MHQLLWGGIRGAVATIPMTFTMNSLWKMLPFSYRYDLPPRIVSMNTLRSLSLKKHLDKRREDRFALLTHFGFGSFAGSWFYLLPKTNHKIILGMGYGLFVWGASYIGIIPALSLIPSAFKRPLERNALMIASHLVWGASLGIMSSKRPA